MTTGQDRYDTMVESVATTLAATNGAAVFGPLHDTPAGQKARERFRDEARGVLDTAGVAGVLAELDALLNAVTELRRAQEYGCDCDDECPLRAAVTAAVAAVPRTPGHGGGALPHGYDVDECGEDCDNRSCPRGFPHARCGPSCVAGLEPVQVP